MKHHFPVGSGLYKYRLMEYGTEYCFSAKTRFLLMPVKCEPSGWQCITTPEGTWYVECGPTSVCAAITPASSAQRQTMKTCLPPPPDPVMGQLKRVVVGIVVPSLCLCMCLVVGYVLYRYLSGSGQKSPLTLVRGHALRHTDTTIGTSQQSFLSISGNKSKWNVDQLPGVTAHPFLSKP